jgi:cytochrome c oxidase cbb3-type subunit 3
MNPTPLWLKLVIVGLVTWGIGYIAVFALSGEQVGAAGRYTRQLQAEADAAVGQLDQLKYDASSLARVRGDDALLAHGQAIFAANCASCHGRSGGGTVTAPNLTDNQWIAAKTAFDVLEITDKGIAERGMPAFHGRLGYNDLIIVSGYVTALHDTNVEGGRAPQGEVVDVLD